LTTYTDTTSATKSAAAKTSAAAATKTASPASTAKSAKQTAKASDTTKASGTAKASQTAKASDSAAATTGGAAASSISVNPVLPAGGVNMITPSALAQTTYYRISDHVTFAWNYTSLSVKPSRIDAIVSCSANSASYTLLSNASFEKTGSVVWDTLPDVTGTAPLLTETYTLVIYDAAEAVTAVAGPGRLGVSNDFMFGMYLPQSYTPLSCKLSGQTEIAISDTLTARTAWKCAVCSAAISDTERQALKFMFGMCLVTVLSFTWFVSGLW